MKLSLKIRTPEGITFAYALAGPVVRCLAWIIDFFVILVGIRLVLLATQVFGLLSQDLAVAIATP